MVDIPTCSWRSKLIMHLVLRSVSRNVAPFTSQPPNIPAEVVDLLLFWFFVFFFQLERLFPNIHSKIVFPLLVIFIPNYNLYMNPQLLLHSFFQIPLLPACYVQFYSSLEYYICCECFKSQSILLGHVFHL